MASRRKKQAILRQNSKEQGDNIHFKNYWIFNFDLPPLVLANVLGQLTDAQRFDSRYDQIFFFVIFLANFKQCISMQNLIKLYSAVQELQALSLKDHDRLK